MVKEGVGHLIANGNHMRTLAYFFEQCFTGKELANGLIQNIPEITGHAVYNGGLVHHRTFNAYFPGLEIFIFSAICDSAGLRTTM
jgi:hypothetical protein